jgi:hypothetical protein
MEGTETNDITGTKSREMMLNFDRIYRMGALWKLVNLSDVRLRYASYY